MPQPDIHFEHHGSIVIMQPLTGEGARWVQEHVSFEPWQVIGGGIACDHRVAFDLMKTASEDGLSVK